MTIPLPPVINYMDFEVLNEPWNKYKLSDGSVLYMRTIAINIIKTGQYDQFGKPIYLVSTTYIYHVRAPKELRGNPTIPQPMPEVLADSIAEDVNATPEKEDWNRYKLEDGTTIMLKAILTRIQRTTKYDQFGEPIYIIYIQNIIKDDVPKNLWKRPL
jgi:hypothetical protein